MNVLMHCWSSRANVGHVFSFWGLRDKVSELAPNEASQTMKVVNRAGVSGEVTKTKLVPFGGGMKLILIMLSVT